MFARVAVLVACLAGPGAAQEADVAGSADHPLMGRYEGSVITAYDVREFDVFPMPTAPGAEGFQEIEGAVTRIAYILPEGVSLAAGERNFEMALEASGFEEVFSCETAECGDISYDLDQFPLPRMIVDRFNYRVLVARREAAGSEAHATVVSSVDTAGRVRVQLGMVESAVLENRMVPAEEMRSEISETGRVALYGVLFDTDSAEIKAESEPTLAEIARFLSEAPDLAVVIVGHTDNVGSLEYNLGLSARRAAAVAGALATQYGISADRMESAGAGFLAPVAPNTDEAGRALNRRVEIIAR